MIAEFADDLRQAVISALEAREEEILAFARELIATPSPNPPGDERAAAGLVTRKLRSLGIEHVEVLGDSPQRPNVIATAAGSGPGPTMILSGHLDTKPVGERSAWKHDPYSAVVEDAELHGLGSGDMKAAVTAMLFAAAEVRARSLPGTLVLVFTADEEAGSVHGSQWLAECGKLEADVAVIGEPCGITREWEAIDVLSRGAALFTVVVHGTQGHSSISDRLPLVNASTSMARLMDRMDRELKSHLRFEPHPLVTTGPTVNVGVMVKGGVFYGVNPGWAEFSCDIRTLPGMTQNSVEHDLREFLALAMQDDPKLDAELRFEIWVPATEFDPAHRVVDALREAVRDVLGEEPPVQGFPGSTDATHFQLTAGIPTVAAFGPGYLSRAHAPNESLPVAGILQAAKIYALAAISYLGSQE